MMQPLPIKPGNKRHRAERGGRLGEWLAELYLRLQFYGVLARRYKTPVGEIDIIASRLGWLVFVEVKSRKTAALEAEALAQVNQARITRAAKYFLSRHPKLAQRPMRFDVIFLAPGKLPRHVRNAFHAAGDRR